MSLGAQFYVSTLLVYAGVDIVACLGLNLQFGVAGVMNFAFILFQAVGAYTAGILTLGPESKYLGFERYLGGAHLPFPLPFLAAALAGGLLSIPIGLVALRRLRSDYQAVAMLVISVIATSIAENDVGLVNGQSGLSLVPQPLASTLGLSQINYQWFYAGLTAAVCLIVYWVVHRLTASPLGRSLRAMRDNEEAVVALGRNVLAKRLLVLCVGGAIAALSGALLVSFIGIWSPAAWEYPETLVLFAAVIVGGAGNNFGAVAGAVLVPVVFSEATRFLPQFGRLGLVDALQWVAIGILIIVFLWVAPRGLFPERRRRFPRAGDSSSRPRVGRRGLARRQGRTAA